MDKNWKVLLIGGGSGVGKSHLARQLSAHYNIPLTEVDDIRIFLQQLVDKKQYPELFAFIDNPDFHNTLDENNFTKKLLKLGGIVWKSLDVLISKHIELNETVIFEGDSIIPELLAKRGGKQIQPLFIYDKIDEIRKRQLKRKRGSDATENLERNALFSYTYGQEVKRQAEANGFLTIKASPLETLCERTIALIDESE